MELALVCTMVAAVFFQPVLTAGGRAGGSWGRVRDCGECGRQGGCDNGAESA
jgi:hypothetical protein